MSTRHPRWILTSGFALALLGSALAHLATGRAAVADAQRTPTPVLVELFTSEGCSSCPPAEDELARLTAQQSVAGARIVPVAFHVDYWDRLGWTDPFSSATWTARQETYARAHGGNLYTPEAVVQGAADCVGSNGGALRGLIERAAQSPAATMAVTRAAGGGADALRVAVKVGALPLVGGERAILRIALTESGVSVAVPRGENGGKTLAHAAIARDLREVSAVSSGGGSFEVEVSTARVARRENLEVVAFVQSETTGRVVAVGTTKPFAP